MNYRLALDLGTNSIGWAQFSLNQEFKVNGLMDGGVHIFDQGRNAESLGSNALERRSARGMRRTRDRKNRRKQELLSALVNSALLPSVKEERHSLTIHNPYELRERGLRESLTAHEFGRALFHLHQRRGFRSNRKSGNGEDGKIVSANRTLIEKLNESNFETYGAFLESRRKQGLPTRLRLQGEGAKSAYEFYPTREMILDEFRLLFSRQRSFGLREANSKVQEEIEKIFFRQRPLKSPLVGRCSFLPEEIRAPKSLPTAQRFRIWSDVLNLRIVDARQKSRPLSLGQLQAAVQVLMKEKDQSSKQLAELLGLNLGETFNFFSKRKSKLLGDQTAALMRPVFKKHANLDWQSLELSEQDAVIEKLLGDENDEELISWLESRFTLTQDQAKSLAQINPSLARSHLSAAAMGRILEVYETQYLPYSEAVKAAGLGHHSDQRTEKPFDLLPYYGQYLRDSVAPPNKDAPQNDVERYGRFPNPTVHIVLGRIRALVNALVERDGKPSQIIIESGRELPLSAQARKDLEREQRENTQLNDKRAAQIQALGHRVTHETLLRMALHEELGPDGKCIFSGEKIDAADALTDRVEIEHILPFARTLDDSRANKTLAVRRINREKGNRSPFEAFGNTPEYDSIIERVHALPKNKRWRFAENAMARFEDEDKWLARQLTDTQYVARLAVRYLTPICEGYNGRSVPVWATPGRLTAQVRHSLGLNEVLGLRGKKNRDDHRHHFVDACIIGLMDRGLLQAVSRIASRSATKFEQDEKIADFVTEALGPLKDPLRAAVDKQAAAIVIAHRPDHSTGGPLLKDTAYGFINNPPQPTYDTKDNSKSNVALRVAFPGDKFKSMEHLNDILSKNTHAKLYQRILPAVEAGTPFKEAAEAAAQALGIRKVKTGYRKNVEAIQVRGKTVKGYVSGGNWAYDLFQCPHHGFGSELINMRAANSPGAAPPWKTKYPEAKRIVRLFGGDMIEIDDPRPGKESARAIFRIQKMTNRKITLCDPHQANVDTRNKAGEKLLFDKAPNVLVKLGLRKLHVSVLGTVRGRASKS